MYTVVIIEENVVVHVETFGTRKAARQRIEERNGAWIAHSEHTKNEYSICLEEWDDREVAFNASIWVQDKITRKV